MQNKVRSNDLQQSRLHHTKFLFVIVPRFVLSFTRCRQYHKKSYIAMYESSFYTTTIQKKKRSNQTITIKWSFSGTNVFNT